jgi:hypothetical protein
MTPPRRESRDETFPGIRLRILGADGGDIAAEQVALFLFDFTVAFELFRRIVEERGTARLTKWDLYRGHRRLPSIERLVVERLRMESPIEVIATTIALTGAGIGAVWASIQAFERIYMLPLNRKKTELEVRKLEQEVRRLESGTLSAHDPRQLEQPTAERVRGSLARIDDDSEPDSGSRSSLPRRTILNALVRRPDDEYRSRREYDDQSRRVIETVQRRLLRNPIQVEQLDFDFDPQLPPPAR